VVKPGKTLVVCRADVAIRNNDRETLCATLLQTLMTMHGRKDEA
jgi:acyl-coenzyme A thioesterase PaaI-like protein